MPGAKINWQCAAPLVDSLANQQTVRSTRFLIAPFSTMSLGLYAVIAGLLAYLGGVDKVVLRARQLARQP